MIESLFVFNRQLDNSLKSRKNKLGKNMVINIRKKKCFSETREKGLCGSS